MRRAPGSFDSCQATRWGSLPLGNIQGNDMRIEKCSAAQECCQAAFRKDFVPLSTYASYDGTPTSSQ